MIRIECPACDKVLNIKDELAGKTIKCPKCEYRIAKSGGDKAAPAKKPPERRPAPEPDYDEAIREKPKPPPMPKPETTRAEAVRPRRDSDRDDDEEERSRRRRPMRDNDEDEERPRRRLVRNDNEDDDDRPQRRGRRDDDDDGPRRGCRDDDDDYDRPKKKKRKGKGFFSKTVGFFQRQSGWVQAILISSAIALLLAMAHPILYAAPMLLGILLMLAGSLLFIYVVITDSIMEFLLCLVVPFYSLFYLIKNWEETKVTFYLQLYGMAVMFSIACMVPFHVLIYGSQPDMFGHRPIVNVNRNDPFPFERDLKKQPGDGFQPDVLGLPKKKDAEPAKLTGDAELDRILANVDSQDAFKRKDAAEKLMAMPPNQQHRAEVVKQLANVARGDSPFFRDTVTDALMVWAAKDDVPLLVELLGGKHNDVRLGVLKGIGRFKDERTVKPVVNCFREFGTQGPAEKAIRELGPMCEGEVLLLLGEKKGTLRNKAIDLLKAIGTRMCIPALRAITAEKGSGLPKKKAEEAIAAIQARGV